MLFLFLFDFLKTLSVKTQVITSFQYVNLSLAWIKEFTQNSLSLCKRELESYTELKLHIEPNEGQNISII